MALVVNDRVKETTTVVGTGAATLLGAALGFQSFAIIGNGNTTYYCISDQGGANWEVGIGTYTASGTTLARTTVLASSNGGALVVFTTGVKDVFVTYPSEKGVWYDASGNVLFTGTTTAANLAYTGTLTGSTGILNIGSGQVYKDASGNVGIGTSSPTAKLDVAATIRSTANVPPTSGSGLEIIGGNTANFIVAYNRTTPAFLPLEIQSSIFTVAIGGAERMRIDSSGNVGIGVSNPSSYGILTAYSASNPTLTIASGNANAYLRLNTTSDLNMYLTNTGGSMTMNTANTERMRIDSSGNVTLQENISVGGAAPTTVGTGITFPAVQSASSSTNTLDDYEEGTWTPVLSFSTNGTMTYTASTASGVYTKIGNVVTCRISFVLTAFTIGTASGQARISLPFTSAQNYFSAPVYSANFTTTYPTIALSGAAVSYVNLYGNTAINTNQVTIAPANFTNVSNILLSITYTV